MNNLFMLDNQYVYFCSSCNVMIASTNLSLEGTSCPVPLSTDKKCQALLPAPETDLTMRIRNQRREITNLRSYIERNKSLFDILRSIETDLSTLSKVDKPTNLLSLVFNLDYDNFDVDLCKNPFKSTYVGAVHKETGNLVDLPIVESDIIELIDKLRHYIFTLKSENEL